MTGRASAAPAVAANSPGPATWLIVATAGMALALLAMTVAETDLRAHYLIDQGEYVSLAGLAFILTAGLYLHTQRRLLASWPLVLPWFLYPVISQGDQIIDNLSITWMRAICHVLLAAIFATPVAVAVIAARRFARRGRTAWVPGLRQMSEGRVREGTATLAVSLLVLEMWLANLFLGTLMIVTLIVMALGMQFYGSIPEAAEEPSAAAERDRRTTRGAFWFLILGAAASAALFLGFKNRAGAYQGSPSVYMDPTQKQGGYRLDAVAVPAGTPSLPSAPQNVQLALSGYAHTLETLLSGYFILDRNYNYHFHNELFLRSTPLLANYRAAGLAVVDEARRQRKAADGAAAAVTLGQDDPLAALLEDMRTYVAFNFDRAATLERLSAEFEQTKAGLQHATHIYEGEGKYLGAKLAEILNKHRHVLGSPSVAPVTADFVATSRAVHDRYANRIVGF